MLYPIDAAIGDDPINVARLSRAGRGRWRLVTGSYLPSECRVTLVLPEGVEAEPQAGVDNVRHAPLCDRDDWYILLEPPEGRLVEREIDRRQMRRVRRSLGAA